MREHNYQQYMAESLFKSCKLGIIIKLKEDINNNNQTWLCINNEIEVFVPISSFSIPKKKNHC